jgi:hypothetical protein
MNTDTNQTKCLKCSNYYTTDSFIKPLCPSCRIQNNKQTGTKCDIRYYRQLLKLYQEGNVDGNEIIGIKKRIENLIQDHFDENLEEQLVQAQEEILPSVQYIKLFENIISIVKIIIANEKEMLIDRSNEILLDRLIKRYREYLSDRDLRIEEANYYFFYSDVNNAIDAIKINQVRIQREAYCNIPADMMKKLNKITHQEVVKKTQAMYDQLISNINRKMIHRKLSDNNNQYS